MDRILIILKKENGPRASSAPALGLNTIIFKHVYWYMQQTQVSVYRTIGPLVFIGQSGMTQPNPNCHVTGPLVFIGQSNLTQSEVTFGLIAGYPFLPF